MTPVDIPEFLAKLQLTQYSETFKVSNISREALLEASPDTLAKLGVTNPLHQMKIMQLFRREVQGTVAKYSTQHLSDFLHQLKLDKYIPNLEQNGIDGDMVLEVEEKLMKHVFKEVGVTNPVHVNKIWSKYKTFTLKA